MNNNSILKTTLFTVLSLMAFAANSVLCRLALVNGDIDAASFTSVRLVSGAVVLVCLVALTNFRKKPSGFSDKNDSKGSWFGACMLFAYAAGFSYAYQTLDAAVGALILFGAVQITMLLIAVLKGNRLGFAECLGVAIAFAGFTYLMLPGVSFTSSAPSLEGLLFMLAAGIAWGLYTLQGRGSVSPLMDTAYNFVRTVPFVLLLMVFSWQQAQYSATGLLLAIVAGGITSGLGYAIWYVALGGLSVSLAAVLQLLVPVITALGGVMLISEAMDARLIIASILVLGGVLMVLKGSYQQSNAANS